MPFPDIQHGIVCEEIRVEQRGLISILGFYGVMPAVEIVAQQLPGPVRLALLFLGGAGDGGTYQVSVGIVGPAGQPVVTAGPHPLTVDRAKIRTNLAFGLMGIVLPQAGTYHVVLTVAGNNRPVYERDFSVRQALPGEIPLA